jgi:RNA polymerase sigma-70 factor (ECF subfamily)
MTEFDLYIQGKKDSARQAYTNEHVFLAYYDEYFQKVYNYIRYRCGDTILTEDLTAVVFEKALAKFSSYNEDRGNFSAWLFTIARNEVNAHLRRSIWSAALSMDSVSDHPSQSPSPEDTCITNETLAALFSALNGLSNRERDLLGLKFSARLTNRQIASLTKFSENNVAIILFRAIHKLRRVLLDQGDPG